MPTAFATPLQHVLAYLKQGHAVQPQPTDQAHNYIRGMNTLASGGSFGGTKSAGQYGAESAQDASDSIRKQGPYLPKTGP